MLRKKIQKKNEGGFEQFPDKQFSKEELRTWHKAIKKAGGRIPWMVSKGIVKLDEKGNVCIVEYENVQHREVMKGSGIYYKTNIPFDFWNEAFLLLDKYEFGLSKSEAAQLPGIEEEAKNMVRKGQNSLL